MTLILKDMIHHGQVRACYYHPDNPKLCVKVSLNKKNDYVLKRELKRNTLFQSTLQDFVPRYHELVDTNFGLGLVCDLITDDTTNTISPILRIWIKTHPLSLDLLVQFQDFFERLLKYHLWFYDFNLENFLIQTINNKQHIVFVDTKSLNRNNSWSCLKLEYFIPPLAKIRMKRRIHRFYQGFDLPIPSTLL